MNLGSLAFEKGFWISTPKARVCYDFMAQCFPPKSMVYTHDLVSSWFKKKIYIIIIIIWMGPKLRLYHGFVDHLLSSFWFFLFKIFLVFIFILKTFLPFLFENSFLEKTIIYKIFIKKFFFWKPFLCKTFLFLNSFSLQFFFF